MRSIFSGMKIHQSLPFVEENGLQLGSRFSYNPNDFRDNAIPGGMVPAFTGSNQFRLGI